MFTSREDIYNASPATGTIAIITTKSWRREYGSDLNIHDGDDGPVVALLQLGPAVVSDPARAPGLCHPLGSPGPPQNPVQYTHPQFTLATVYNIVMKQKKEMYPC